MKVLFSAYAGEPGKGSEPAAGWHWPVECARLGHETWVLTRANNRETIEKVLPGLNLKNLHFIYFDLPEFFQRHKKSRPGMYLYYAMWQWAGARHAARELARRNVVPDIIHHITFGSIRHPTYVSRIPHRALILGPLGGGESCPWRLRSSYNVRGFLIDALRDVHTWLTSFTPAVRRAYRVADLILCKTPQSAAWIPARYAAKTRTHLEVGADAIEQLPVSRAEVGPTTLKILYAGRLIYWKGLQLGLRALAELDREMPDWELTVIGGGPDTDWMKSLARRLGIDAKIEWVPQIDQKDLFARYPQFDVFLFPSLHDSSAYVVLEALAFGLPVVCVDNAGPAEITTPDCGIRVPVKMRTTNEVVRDLAAALQGLSADRQRRNVLSQGATRRAAELTWARTVAPVYGEGGWATSLLRDD